MGKRPARLCRVARVALSSAVLLPALAVLGDGAAGAASAAPLTARVDAAAGISGRFNPVLPRVVRGVDGAVELGYMAPGVPETVTLAGVHGVPAVDVGAVVLDVRLQGGGRAGELRLAAPSAAGAPAPLVFGARQDAQNQVVVALDDSGAVRAVTSRAASVSLTVVGWLDTTSVSGDTTVLRQPVRALGTATTGRRVAQTSTVVDLRTRASLPATVTAVIANLTVSDATARNSYLEVRPSETRRRGNPAVSFNRGRPVSHQAIVPVGRRGAVALTVSAGTASVTLDVVGYLTAPTSGAGPGLHAAPMSRALDTRRTSRFVAGRAVPLTLAGQAGVPASASSVTAVVTAVGGEQGGGQAIVAPYAQMRGVQPTRVLTVSRQNRSALVTLPLGPRGAWTVLRASSVHVVVDVVGWSVEPPVSVRPPDAALIAAGAQRLVAEREDVALARGILVEANRYAMGTWWHDVRPALLRTQLDYQPRPGTPRRGFERSVKNDPLADPARRIANVSFGMATLVTSGGWQDARIGVSRATGIARAVQLLTHLLGGHLTQHVDGWGGGWQGSLISGYVGRAAWLLWDHLPAGLRQQAAEMVAHEADDIAGRPTKYLRDRAGATVGVSGDSKAEEMSWEAMPGQLALAMFPSSDHRSAWAHSVVSRALGSWARPSDVSRSVVVQGRPLSAWLGGSNVEVDGTVVNHARVAPDYMALTSQTLDQVWVQAAAGQAAPAAARTLVEPVFDAMTDRVFDPSRYAAPGGTIYHPESGELYYPEGIDWGRGMQLIYALMDVQTAAYGVGDESTRTKADYFALRHLRAAAAMQARFADGRTYSGATPCPDPRAPSCEFNYVGREELILQVGAQTVLALAVRDAGAAVFTDKPYDAL